MIQLGLRAKLTSAIALLIVIFAGFFWFYFPSKQVDAAEQSLETRLRDVGVAFKSFGRALAGMEYSQLDRTLEDFATQEAAEGIEYVVFAAINGPDAGYERIPSDLRNSTRITDSKLGYRIGANEDYAQISVPIDDVNGDLAGIMTIGLTRASVHQAKANSQTIALIVSAAIFIVGVFLSWLVSAGIATPILAAAAELDTVSNSLVAAARDQEASAAQEAAAVAETRRSMETLLDSAQQIADRSGEVLGNAERSTGGSQQIAQRIGTLNELAENVAELLRIIVQVADKADLLALNASLEGTRAGEAGKGFALVASEMRRLAENVIESVAGIRVLMKDMREASQAAVVASQEGTHSSTATTHSAREIALLTQEQRQATEQVMASMDEMGDILNHTLRGIQRTTSSANQLTGLAGRLARMVNPSLLNRGSDDGDDGDLELSSRISGRHSRISAPHSRISGPHSRISAPRWSGDAPRFHDPARFGDASRVQRAIRDESRRTTSDADNSPPDADEPSGS